MTALPKIAIAADHGGYALKEAVKAAFKGRVEWVDMGAHSDAPCNYAAIGLDAGRAVSDGTVERAVVICGTGIGISIAANRYAKVRCALCTDATMARFARSHNDANMLALGARVTGVAVALDCVEMFLATPYEGGRHQERVDTLETGI